MSDEQRPIGNTGYLTELDIRIYLRDNDPGANLLLDDLEFSPQEIRQAVTIAVDQWNDTPPDLAAKRYTEVTFPYRWALLQGVSANLLTMAGHRYRRNQLNYAIPGGSVDDQNKAPQYDAAAAKHAAAWVDWIARKKVELNANLGWGRDW